MNEILSGAKQTTEKSERFFQELQQLEKSLPQIEAEEKSIIEDPEMQRLTLSLLTSQYLLDANHEIIKTLQKRLVAKAKEIRARREGYYGEHGKITQDLMALTAPVIRGYMEELSDLEQRPKLSREILNKKYDGFKQQTMLTVETNEKPIRLIHKLVQEAIRKLHGMSLCPVGEIRNAFIEARLSLEEIDWHATEQMKVDEAEFFKFSFPQAVDPAYRGPLSGLR